ncbi:MAG TPA: hypothetical protein V6C72_13320, partial [Chroococcales cyanobacterium]
MAITLFDTQKLVYSVVSVIEIFTPVTKAIVAKVKLHSPTHGFPDIAVLKVYDPRCTDNREPLAQEYPPHPWSLELEIASYQRRADV